MGNLLPAGALGKQLTWTDFGTPKPGKAPGSGQTATAAFTSVSVKIAPSGMNFKRATYLRPPNFKMVEDPDITVTMDNKSFVMSWVSGMAQADQNALLAHEQGHYDITSIQCGDLFAELQTIIGTAYSTAKTGAAAAQAVRKRYLPIQPIHNKYDKDTNHGLNVGPQANWTAAIADARLPTNTLLGSLKAAGLYP